VKRHQTFHARLERIVYARHDHELMGCESPVGEPGILKILKRLAKGNCKVARLCGEEACSKAVSRGTRTSWKAASVGKLAQGNEAQGSADTVNGAAVL